MFFGKNYDQFNRNYMKIQEVFAQIGGFCNFFYLLLFYIFHYLSSTNKILQINEKIIFSNGTEKDKKMSIITKRKPSKSSIVNNNICCISEIVRESNNIVLETDKKFFRETEVKKKLESFKDKNNIQTKLNLSFYFKYVLCPSRMVSQDFNIMKLYSERKQYVDDVFNIYTFINFYTEFQFIKKLLLNENQIHALKILSPKYVKEEEDVTRFIQVEEYFAEIKRSKSMNDIDHKLFDLLNVDYHLKEDLANYKSFLTINIKKIT